MSLARGAFRWVLLTRRYAIKFPRPRYWLLGMRCNRWEREMWRDWRPAFEWTHLCPVVLADSLGLIVVMPRAKQPVTFDDIVAGVPDDYPSPTEETKPDSYGWLDGRLVAIDYGLASADLVRERRRYYETHPCRRK